MRRFGAWLGRAGEPFLDLIGRERTERVFLPVLEWLDAQLRRFPRLYAWLESREGKM